MRALDVSEKSHQELGGAECRLWRRAERIEMGRFSMIPPQQTRCGTEDEGRSRRGGKKDKRKEMSEKCNQEMDNGIL